MSGSRSTRSPNIAVFSKTLDIAGKINKMCLGTSHFRKPRVVSLLCSLLIRNEVPLACEDGEPLCPKNRCDLNYP